MTALHVDCPVPHFVDRRAVRTFVVSTLDACRDRVASILDREIARALTLRRDAESAWRDRLARRDDAIERARQMRHSAPMQPLLFEELADDAMRRGGRRDGNEDRERSRAYPSVARPATAAEPQQPRPGVPASSAAAVTERSLALVLVVP